MILFTNVNCNHKYIFIVEINIALQIEIWGKKEEVSDRKYECLINKDYKRIFVNELVI